MNQIIRSEDALRVTASVSGNFRGQVRFDASPSYRAAADRFFEGTEEHNVHHLAVIKSLENEWGEKSPILVAFQEESDDAGQQINQHENGEENQRTFHVLGGPELGEARDTKLTQTPESNRNQEQQVNDRRNQRQDNLE